MDSALARIHSFLQIRVMLAFFMLDLDVDSQIMKIPSYLSTSLTPDFGDIFAEHKQPITPSN